jgi:prepilin-type N-terminal cleavage/methylation domain-containing protein
MNQHAFTLIELMVVIAIIAILSTMGISNFQMAIVKARDARRISDLHNLQQALVMYRSDKGSYPTGSGQIDPALLDLTNPSDPGKGYIRELPKPPMYASTPSENYIYTPTPLGCGSGGSTPRCAGFTLCTGGIPSQSQGLENKDNVALNASDAFGGSCGGTGGSTCKYYCVFSP